VGETGPVVVALAAATVLDETTLSAAFGHRVRRLVDGDTVALVAG